MKISTIRTQNPDGSFCITARFEGTEKEVQKAMKDFEDAMEKETGLKPDFKSNNEIGN